MTPRGTGERELVDRLGGWVREGERLLKELGGGAAAWAACRQHGASLRGFDGLLERLETLAHARHGPGLSPADHRRDAA